MQLARCCPQPRQTSMLTKTCGLFSESNSACTTGRVSRHHSGPCLIKRPAHMCGRGHTQLAIGGLNLAYQFSMVFSLAHTRGSGVAHSHRKINVPNEGYRSNEYVGNATSTLFSGNCPYPIDKGGIIQPLSNVHHSGRLFGRSHDARRFVPEWPPSVCQKSLQPFSPISRATASWSCLVQPSRVNLELLRAEE